MMPKELSDILGLDRIQEKPPELTNEIAVSNLVLRMDAKICEVINYLEMYQNDKSISPEILKIAIEKLDKI